MRHVLLQERIGLKKIIDTDLYVYRSLHLKLLGEGKPYISYFDSMIVERVHVRYWE